MSFEQNLNRLNKIIDAISNPSSVDICCETGCNKIVSKKGHKYCYDHWKKHQQLSSGLQTANQDSFLSASKIGEKLGIPQKKVNAILSDLGLLTKESNGWKATKLGLNFGAVEKVHPQDKTPYVLWPKTILENQVFITTIEQIKGNIIDSQTNLSPTEQEFRDKFRSGANHRTTDGHWVRSKAEVIIDNWLYISGLVHAYERRIPIPEEMYCDFYIPVGKVYVEYWGYNNNPEYLERKKVKQKLYQKYGLSLIELEDEHIRNLDDHLPRMLLQFGVNVAI